MRLMLKTTEGYVKMYWVEVQAKSIVGWFFGENIQKELGLTVDIDAHFTYPSDGNYHFSYKAVQGTLEEYISVFHDKVKIKIISNGNADRNEKGRGDLHPIVEHFVPNGKLPPLSDIKIYQFPTIGFNVFKGTFNFKKLADAFVNSNDIRGDDLVVDISQLDDYSVNIYATIQPSNQIFVNGDTIQWHYKSISLSTGRTLDLICRIEKRSSEPSVSSK